MEVKLCAIAVITVDEDEEGPVGEFIQEFVSAAEEGYAADGLAQLHTIIRMDTGERVYEYTKAKS